jgi:pimeloyl-ACP methyl ester carboxylesterase
MPTAAIGDLKMHYLEQGSGQPVVLIHGNTSSSVWWEYTLARMGDGYHVIAPDLRGRGDTEGPAADWTIETLADDVRGLVEHLGLGTAHFVGHSLGSNVALQYALDHPADVKSLTLLNPGWVAGDMPAMLADMARIGAMVANKDQLKLALRGIAIHHPDDDAWKRLEAASLKQKDEASLRGPAALQAWAVADRLGELAGISTLVVRGADDQYLSTHAVCWSILENLPGARYLEIPGASHSPNVETPDAWTAALLNHLASVE